jgi:hypothetical protein
MCVRCYLPLASASSYNTQKKKVMRIFREVVAGLRVTKSDFFTKIRWQKHDKQLFITIKGRQTKIYLYFSSIYSG